MHYIMNGHHSRLNTSSKHETIKTYERRNLTLVPSSTFKNHLHALMNSSNENNKDIF